MTDLRTAAQQALEALEKMAHLTGARWALEKNYAGHLEAITSLKAALEQPVQEPVAWLFTNLQSGDYDFCYQEDDHDHDREMWHKQPLYAHPAPPQRDSITQPVQWMGCGECDCIFPCYMGAAKCMRLNAPPQNSPLTDEEIGAMYNTHLRNGGPIQRFARSLEAARNIGEKE